MIHKLRTRSNTVTIKSTVLVRLLSTPKSPLTLLVLFTKRCRTVNTKDQSFSRPKRFTNTVTSNPLHVYWHADNLRDHLDYRNNYDFLKTFVRQ